MMNKRGEKLYVFWWFVVCIVVFVVIITVTVNFIAMPIDVRGIQTKIEYNNVYTCLVNQGYLNQNILNSEFDLSQECHLLDGKTLADLKTLFFVNVTDEASKSLTGKFIALGDFSIKSDCEITKVGGGKYFPVCYERISPVYYFVDGKKKIAYLDLMVATNYGGERLSNLQGVAILGGGSSQDG